MSWPAGGRRSVPDSVKKIGISIPAYKNVESLRRSLESVSTHAPEAADSVVVVDDSGSGLVADQLRALFPHVQWIVHRENRGFGTSATEAVLANPARIVILLNDDVELLSGPLTALNAAFRDPGLLAVTFRSVDEQGNFREGAKRLVWRMGWPRVLHNERDQQPAVGGVFPSSYAVGGHAAFDREKFAELGGFDPLFEPFYWEDVDLSLRAAQRGWHCQYLPECTVRHAGQSAIRSAHEQEYIREITMRNRLLFAWRHGSTVQSSLLETALVWDRMIAWVKGNRTFRRALRAAKERWQTHQNLKDRASEIIVHGAPVDR